MLTCRCPLLVKIQASDDQVVAYLKKLWNTNIIFNDTINNDTIDIINNNHNIIDEDNHDLDFEIIDDITSKLNINNTTDTSNLQNEKKEEILKQLKEIKNIGINSYNNTEQEKQTHIDLITEENINHIYDYKYSDKPKIETIKKINKGIIFTKYKSGCLNDPENFRYLVNHHNSIKILDRLWCTKVHEKCGENLPDKNIYKAPLFKSFNTTLMETIFNNTISIDNKVLIDIAKAFDSLEWDMIEELLLANLTKKINEITAKELVYEYILILKNRELYYNNIKVSTSKGVSTGLPSSTIVFTLVFEEIIYRWLSLYDYKIDIDFRINIYVDDIYIEILNKEKANEIISSLIIHLEYYKLFINKNKTKADPNLNIECINNAIFSTDYYLGIPFTRDIKLYGKIILAELNKKIHVDWNDVYNILSDDNPTLYKSICTGFFSYKLKPLYMYYAKCNNNYNFDNDIIKQFIHDNYVIEENIINIKNIDYIQKILFISGALIVSLSLLSFIGLKMISIYNK